MIINLILLPKLKIWVKKIKKVKCHTLLTYCTASFTLNKFWLELVYNL